MIDQNAATEALRRGLGLTPTRLAELAKLVRFGLVGGGATATHFLVALGLAELAGLPLHVANCMGFATAFGVSVLGHHYWTFQSSHSLWRTLPRFGAVAVTGFVASNVFLTATIVLGLGNDTVKIAIAALIVPALSYVLSRFWAFK